MREMRPRRGDPQTRVVASVLDRLIAPKSKGEVGESRIDSIEALEQAVRRDLSAVLNTRRAQEIVPPEFPQAAASLLAFGLPDFTLQNLRLSSEQQKLRRAIESAIRVFEPRLSGISVLMEPWDEGQPALRFRVEALLRSEAGSESIAFNTVLHSDTGQFSVDRQRV